MSTSAVWAVHQELVIKCGLSKKPHGSIINMSHNSCDRTPTINHTVTGPQQLIELSMYNNKLAIVILDKTIKEAYLKGRSISPKSRPSQHHHRESPEVYTLERRDYKNMATVNGLCDTTSIIHNEYYSKQITQKFKTT